MNQRRETSSRLPSIMLSGPDDPCVVLGHPKPALGRREYAVVKALVDAYPASLSRQQLEGLAGDDAHQLIMSLRKKDTSWSTAILIPSRGGKGGYRLL